MSILMILHQGSPYFLQASNACLIHSVQKKKDLRPHTHLLLLVRNLFSTSLLFSFFPSLFQTSTFISLSGESLIPLILMVMSTTGQEG